MVVTMSASSRVVIPVKVVVFFCSPRAAAVRRTQRTQLPGSSGQARARATITVLFDGRDKSNLPDRISREAGRVHTVRLGNPRKRARCRLEQRLSRAVFCKSGFRFSFRERCFLRDGQPPLFVVRARRTKRVAVIHTPTRFGRERVSSLREQDFQNPNPDVAVCEKSHDGSRSLNFARETFVARLIGFRRRRPESGLLPDESIVLFSNGKRTQ